MGAVEVDAKMGEMLKFLSELDVKRLEKLKGHIDKFVAKKKSPNTAEREAQLVKLIKQKIPKELFDYEQDLMAKLHDGTITAKEKEDLNSTIHFLEELAAERLKLIAELAKLRRQDFDIVCKEFIKPKL
jgi:hypothetical protein